jgi:hypothetical protein
MISLSQRKPSLFELSATLSERLLIKYMPNCTKTTGIFEDWEIIPLSIESAFSAIC